MSAISTTEDFQNALSSLSLAEQRQLGARFVASVLDLTDDPRVKSAEEVASRVDSSAEELAEAHQMVHSAYVATSPRSWFSELDYTKQAAHFVAEACLTCLAPTYHETHTHKLASRVAMYCQMARACSAIEHKDIYPGFGEVEDTVKKEVDAQCRILDAFMQSR